MGHRRGRAVSSESFDVAVVGGGPAGSITATLLAGLGREVVLLERAPRWRWRACGVFASPASIAVLRDLGLAEPELRRIARPLRGMEVVSRRGTRFRLDYGGSGALADSAVGFDRSTLDPLLLERAGAAGVSVREGVSAERIHLEGNGSRVELSGAERGSVEARVVLGADGLRSGIAVAAGVARRAELGVRAALSFHVPGDDDGARMHVFRDGYAGLAPVPGGRVNVGIVLGRSWFVRLRRDGARAVARQILATLPGEDDRALAARAPLDAVAGVTPLGHAVSRRAGDGWLLVGDAAGFLDPFTGEGLHRAFVSATLAAETVAAALDGRPGARLTDYDRAMRSRFATKDLVSRVVQGFLGHPPLFEYAARRLASRTRVRETMGLVIGDLAPAGRALDPRYLAALLAP